MKTRLYLLVAVSLLAASCVQQPTEFSTRTLKGERNWEVTIDDSTTTWVHNSYNLEWPSRGAVSSAVEEELLNAVFGSQRGKDLRRCCENYLNSQGLMEDVEGVRYPCYQIDALPDTVPYTEQELTVSCRATERLVTFDITSYVFPAHAAHGFYDVTPLVVDRESGRVLHLTDLVDTNALGQIVARAVDKLPANSQVKECLFDEFRGQQTLPVSRVFNISDGMDTIRLVYGLYWLTPYACGIQEVSLPVGMLRENMALTDKGLKLFSQQ